MKPLRFLPPVLLVLQLFLPACEIAGIALDLHFTLYNPLLYALISAILTLAATVALCIWELPQSKIRSVIYLLLLPVAIFNGLFWLASRTAMAVILALVNAACAAVLLFRRGKKGRIAVFMLCIPLALLLTWAGFIAFLLDGMSVDTVIRELNSPQGRYTAQVISNSQGALGGDTYVEVKDHRADLDLLVGAFSLPAERVYSGEWGEHEDMQILWEDERTLVINGERYYLDN